MLGVDALIAGEGGQGEGKGVRRHPRQQTPPALPRAGPDEARDIQPRSAATGPGRWPFGAQTRRTTGNKPRRCSSCGPERDRCRRMGGAHRRERGGKPPFLNAAWAAGSARVSRGRGRCGVKPNRRIHSQPRCTCTGRPRVWLIHRATLRHVQTPPSGAGPARAWRNAPVAAPHPAAARPPDCHAAGRRWPAVRPGSAGPALAPNAPNTPSRGPPQRWPCRPPAARGSASDCAPPDPPLPDSAPPIRRPSHAGRSPSFVPCR